MCCVAGVERGPPHRKGFDDGRFLLILGQCLMVNDVLMDIYVPSFYVGK